MGFKGYIPCSSHGTWLEVACDYMYDFVYLIYAFVKFLDETPNIICLSATPGFADPFSENI